jgi:beta-glucosidase-like glycosyl hydrolase
MTREPLLIACDIVKLSVPGQSAGQARAARFGDGWVGGFIGRFRGLPDGQFGKLARLNAFVFSALGMNVALGPTVDDSTRDPRTAERARLVTAELRRFSLLPVLKHFPFLPAAANLHRQSPDTKVALRVAEQRAGIFRALSRESGVLMTTHLLDSLVDRDMVTFSPAWNRILRRVTGFDGLLMSDGLLMLSNYVKPDDPVQWAQRAVLAGHDFLIVEGSAAVTWQVFEGLLEAACTDDEDGRALRGRIRESTARIERFKKANSRLLRREAEVPAAAVAAAVALAPAEGTEPAAWRMDAAGFEALEPALRAAAQR